MTEEDQDQIIEDDFLIRIRPIKDQDGFTGEAQFSVITSVDNSVPDELYTDFEFIIKCMLATIPLMESDEDFKDFVLYYVDNLFKYEFDERNKPTIESVDGNVITLRFDSTTKGNA